MGLDDQNRVDTKLSDETMARVAEIKSYTKQVQQELSSDTKYYKDDVLGRFEVYLSTGVAKIDSRLAGEENTPEFLNEILRYCEYLARQYQLFELRKKLLDGDVSQPFPVTNINDLDGLEQAFQGFESVPKVAVGLASKRFRLPPKNGALDWENGAGFSMKLLECQSNHHLLEYSDTLQTGKDAAVLYREKNTDAFFASLIIKGIVPSDDRIKDLFIQTVFYLRGEVPDATDQVRKLADLAQKRDVEGIVDMVGQKKKGVGELIDELAHADTEVKNKLFLSRKIKALGLQNIEEADFRYMAASHKAVLERVVASLLLEQGKLKPEHETMVVDLLTGGSGDQTVKWKTGLLLADTVPSDKKNYDKIVAFCKAAFRKSQRSGWYFAFNVAKNGSYPELNEFVKEQFLAHKMQPEYEALIVNNAEKILGSEWRNILGSFETKDQDLQVILREKLDGHKEEGAELDIDLQKNEDRVKGALFGHALGDALGAPIEILKLEQIQKLYGTVDDFVTYEYQTLPAGDYTDDTALTMVGMESILSKKRFDPADYSERLAGLVINMDYGRDEDRHFSEGSSMAMRRLSIGQSWRFSGNESGKNGSAIRMVPLAVLDLYDPQKNLKENVHLACHPTHRDALAQECAYITALAVRTCLESDHFDGKKFLGTLMEACQSDILRKKLENAGILVERNASVEEAQKMLGTTGLAAESVPYAIYCFLRNPYHFKDVMVAALNVEGDSDSIAAMAGSFCGALNGYSKLPKEWIEKLTCKDKLESYFAKTE